VTIDELLANLEARLPSIVRRSVSLCLCEALDDLKKQQRERARFLSLADAERLYGISRRKLLEFIRKGQLPAYGPRDAKTQGKLLVGTDEIEAFIRRYRITSEMDIDKAMDEAADEVLRTMSPNVNERKAASSNRSEATHGRRLRRG
jgi:Helix-turn-helix domain